MRLSASQVLTPEGLRPATVTMERGQITSVEPDIGEADLHLAEGYLAPGLIDLQINGAYGIDFAAATPSDWAHVNASLPRTGVTAFLPTIITNPVEALVQQLSNAPHEWNSAHAQPLGFHVEGPFISGQHRGVHRQDYITDPDLRKIEALIQSQRVRMITMAPEAPGAMDAVTALVNAGIIVSVGHSGATSAQTHSAADYGARMVTHLFNAMTGLHHREPGVVGAALTDPRLTCGLIADLVHVTAEAIQIAFASAPERIALVTDALSGLGVTSGSFEFGGNEILIGKDGVARSADGILAGSIVRMDHAVGNCIDIGIDEAEALRAATTTPARVLQDHTRGKIVEGSRADLVWLARSDGKLTAQATWINGEQVFAA